eukprot:TRINITY_DN64272_c0_g1_i1.p1 TRINITY_DN64272_c0_g1~~TRINITY_DN64272_c0_g1_i1.p1  ORF type:complete len:152 (+),score=19.52 TRINITY_DN64272_c0_g1_i1:120-575(+)
MIRRPPRSTLSSSSAASDVYKRQGGGEGVVEPNPGQGWSCEAGVCVSDAVDCFNSSGSRVMSLTLSEPRSRLAAVGSHCRVVFAGGRNTSTVGSAAVDIFDVCKGLRIMTSVQLSVPRADLAGAIIGDTAVFIGGNQNGTVSDGADVLTIK